MLSKISDIVLALKKKCWDDQPERSKGVLEGTFAANLGFGIGSIALGSWAMYKGYVNRDAQIGSGAKPRQEGEGIL